VKGGALLLAGVVWLAGGCGGGALVAGRGGPDAGDVAPDTRSLRGRSFDVTVTLTVTPPAGLEAAWSDFPKTLPQTLVLVGD
jgi:hypothetical protein